MLPGILGWITNVIGISYVIVTTVLFLFPPDLPVTGSNMSTSLFLSPLTLPPKSATFHHNLEQPP